MTVVTLRAVRPSDSATLLAWRNSPDVRAFMYTDHEISPQEHALWFDRALVDPRRRYWIIEVDGVGVGLANLYDMALAHGRASWAYYIADPAVRGRGVGAMAEFLVLEEAFGPLALSKLWCEVLKTNTGVIKLHKRFGFVEEARLRRHVVKGGDRVDVIGLGLLADDWAAARPAMVQRLTSLGFSV